MSRRLLAVLTACCIVALSASAVAFAHGNGGRGHHHHHALKHDGKVHRTGHPAGFFGAGLLGASVNSLAQRLSVDPATLRTAIKQTVAAERAKRHAAAPKGHHKTKPDLDAIKNDLATSLAQKLGKTPAEILAAVRAELDARLTQAVSAGWLTQKGHDLALACFDDPKTCDVKALKAEIRFPGHLAPAPQPSTSTPSDTAPSGTMQPGGQATSTPLR